MPDSPKASLDHGYESKLTAGREEIATELTGIAEGMLTGAIQVGTGENIINITIPDELSLEIEYEVEADEVGLELELEWPAPGDDSDLPDTEQLSGEEDMKPARMTAEDESSSSAQFEVFQDQSNEWRWRLRHHNGEVIATSGEGYTQKHNAKKGLRSVMKNSPNAVIRENSLN